MKLLRIFALVALCLAYAPTPALAVTGYDSAYSGESAYVNISPGETASFQVFFSNTGTLTWTKGGDTQVDLAACLADKVTCPAQDPADSSWNSGWLSATRYATTTQATVAPGAIATFVYNIKAPSDATGTHRFNGDLVVASSGARIHPQGYYQDATVPAIGNIPLPTPTPTPTQSTGGGGGTTPTPVADLSMTKTSSAEGAVTPGTQLTYTLTASNAGPNDAQNVSVSDALPANTTFVSLAAPTGWTATTPAVGGTGTATATKSTLAASSTAIFTLVVKVNASASPESTIRNTALVTSATSDTNVANNTASTTDNVGAGSADLSILKTGPETVQAGANLTYSLTTNNAGPSDANNVSLSDTLPAGTTFVSFTVPSGWTTTTPAPGGTGTVTASKSQFAANSSATFTLVVKVNANVPAATTLSNTATVGASTSDPDRQNNSATTTTTVGTVADLSVVKSDSPDPVMAGNSITYTITGTNNGSSDAQNVALFDVIPVGTTFWSFTQNNGPAFTLNAPAQGATGTAVGTIATLGAGISATFTLVVKVPANTADNATITNTATITSSTADSNPANNSDTETTTVNTLANLRVTKTGSPDPVAAGTNITYAIVVTNGGPSDAQTVMLTDAIPANTTFVSFTAPAGWTSVTPPVDGTGSVTATTATLAAGASANFTLVVKVNKDAAPFSTISNTVSVGSATIDPDHENNSATVTTTVANDLRCFDGTTDTLENQGYGPYGGVCTLTPNGAIPTAATLNNSVLIGGGDYSGVYYKTSSLAGKTLSQVTSLGFTYGGDAATAGSPRISLPTSLTDGAGNTIYAFIGASACNDGAGHVDAINDTTCTIFITGGPSSGYANWTDFTAANPGVTIGTTPFVIADDAGLWTVSNVNLGQ